MEEIEVTTQTLDELETFLKTEKFVPEEHYFGAPNPEIKARCEANINLLIKELITGLPKQSTRSFVLDVFKKHLEKFDLEDTEEREQAATYCERIMDILKIECSDGALNDWMYGF